jgi:hypothetical protein
MWAEIYLHAKNDLPANLATALSTRIQTTPNIQAAIDATTWAGETDSDLPVVIAAHQSVTLTCLLFSPDVRTLRAHVESSIDKSDLRQLRKSAEEVGTRLLEFLGHANNKATDLKIYIYAENNHLQTGERRSWWRRFADSIKQDFLVKIYVPAATFLASIILGYEVTKAGFNVLAAVCAMLVWSLIASTFVTGSAFTYSGELT